VHVLELAEPIDEQGSGRFGCALEGPNGDVDDDRPSLERPTTTGVAPCTHRAVAVLGLETLLPLRVSELEPEAGPEVVAGRQVGGSVVLQHGPVLVVPVGVGHERVEQQVPGEGVRS
jgi:hypothetical protein